MSKLDNLAVRSARASCQLRYLQTTRDNNFVISLEVYIATQFNFECAVKDPFYVDSCKALNYKSPEC